MVKASHQQAAFDMLTAGNTVLDQMKIAHTKLFLAGWSQGGFVTKALLEKLESTGVAVDGRATASAPVDIYPALSGFLSLPRKNDASWVNTLFILSSFSFENYYGMPELARALLADDAHDIARKACEREPFDAAQVPTDLHKLIRPEYFDPQYFAQSAYGRIVLSTNAYCWVIKSAVRNYYGESDEVISVGLGELAATYQRASGAGNTRVEAISTGDTSHRGTYVRAAPQWMSWFDELSRQGESRATHRCHSAGGGHCFDTCAPRVGGAAFRPASKRGDNGRTQRAEECSAPRGNAAHVLRLR